MSQDNPANSNLGFFKRDARAGATYFRIFENMLCQTQKVDGPDATIDGWEGPVKTTNPNNKKDVWTCLIRYDSLAAFVLDANRFSKQFTPEQGGGKINGLSLTLQAGDSRGVLQLNWQKTGPEPVLKRFLMVAPNINFEMPLLISAWKNQAGKQAVSFRQGTDPDPTKWEKVEQYWKRPVDPVTQQATGDAVGADGTVLPQPIHDDFDDSWDYAPQNKFVMKYFIDNIEPKIKEIAKRHDISFPGPEGDQGEDQQEAASAPMPTSIPEVTKQPDNPKATSLADTATGMQRMQIKALAELVKMDFEARCPEIMGCTFDELSKEAASFVKFQLTNMAKAKGLEIPPGINEVPKQQAQETPVANSPQPESQSDDPWGAAPAPSGSATPAAAAVSPAASTTPEKDPWD